MEQILCLLCYIVTSVAKTTKVIQLVISLCTKKNEKTYPYHQGDDSSGSHCMCV